MNVIRTVLFKKDGEIQNLNVSELINHLEYLGYIQVQRDDAEGICIDFKPPRYAVQQGKSGVDTWCEMNAARLASFGHNAVVSPEAPK